VSPLDPDRCLPIEPSARATARELLQASSARPLVCPHGHVGAALLADDLPFPNATDLLIRPDHYVTRMLVSAGVPFDHLLTDEPRAVWGSLCDHWSWFRATPTRLWWEYQLVEVFAVDPVPTPETYDAIGDCLSHADWRPRALFDRFGIEVLATTDGALDDLDAHARLDAEPWIGRVIPTLRPDDVVDPDRDDWCDAVERLGELAAVDVTTFDGYLDAIRARRVAFAGAGATATDHGHPTAATADLDRPDCERLYRRLRSGERGPDDAETFRAQMLTELAAMSIEDGLVMQLHPGSLRDHHSATLTRWGRNRGVDIPTPTDFVRGLRPLLERFGMDPRLRLIVFTLDESTYSRELAPLAGVYPSLMLGPAWWFGDSPEGMRRFRELTTETAGFRNTVGFVDDTRGFTSIPARHDLARRVDASFLATLVVSGRLGHDEALDVAVDLADAQPRRAYRLDGSAVAQE
jgi:glucuronate isomerase